MEHEYTRRDIVYEEYSGKIGSFFKENLNLKSLKATNTIFPDSTTRLKFELIGDKGLKDDLNQLLHNEISNSVFHGNFNFIRDDYVIYTLNKASSYVKDEYILLKAQLYR